MDKLTEIRDAAEENMICFVSFVLLVAIGFAAKSASILAHAGIMLLYL